MNSKEKPIPTSTTGIPARIPYDLTKDPVWKKGVAKQIDVRCPEKHYKEKEDG